MLAGRGRYRGFALPPASYLPTGFRLVVGVGKMKTRSSSAPSCQGGAACVSGWKWARRGGLTDVEDFVCSQLSGQLCLRPWLVVGRAKAGCHRGLSLSSAVRATLLASLAGGGGVGVI